jgi:hypothetical protein
MGVLSSEKGLNVMPHSIGVGATLVALNREAEASPTQFFPVSVRHYD